MTSYQKESIVDDLQSNKSTNILHEQNSKEVIQDDKKELSIKTRCLHHWFPNTVAVILISIFMGTILGAAILAPYLEENPLDLPGNMRFNEIKVHLEKLYEIAKNHPSGSRSVINGYNASAEYVWEQIEKAAEVEGMEERVNMSRQFFKAPIYQQKEKPTLGFTYGAAVHEFNEGVDFVQVTYGGNGVYSISQGEIGHLAANVSGCSETDFSGHGNKIVLMAYDVTKCELAVQATNAQRANVKALIVYNKPSRNSLVLRRVKINDWRQTTEIVDIPVLSVTNSIGTSILTMVQNPTPFVLKITTNSIVTLEYTYNIIVDYNPEGEDIDLETVKIISVGAHLDGVPEGPGINDNGSGSSTVLELVRQALDLPLDSKYILRFFFWGAEEIGLVGSRHYVRELSQKEKDQFALYINYDMLGSPNFLRSIHDGATALNQNVRGQSAKLTGLFMEMFNKTKEISHLVPMVRGSDFVPFADAGITSGGVKTGAGALKTEVERDWFGGFANAPLDPCYHKYCDTVKNINGVALEQIAKNAAKAIEFLASHNNVVEYLSEE